jgi:uncharacterized RmlC-like cupin family protein
VTDWGRGREIHVDRSMQCIHFEVAPDSAPGADGEILLVADFLTVALREAAAGQAVALPAARCAALMMLTGQASVRHAGAVEPAVCAGAGDTVLLPAALQEAALAADEPAKWLEITLPDA